LARPCRQQHPPRTAQELTLWRSASKVARRWRATAWVSRHALVALVAGLAVINAGVYAQLVAAHVGDGPR
jgi:hypothetical protein